MLTSYIAVIYLCTQQKCVFAQTDKLFANELQCKQSITRQEERIKKQLGDELLLVDGACIEVKIGTTI